MKIDIVVTKNPSFLAYLIRAGIVESATPWHEHGTLAALIGKHVISDDLPYCLSCVALSYTEIPLLLPRELVGRKLIVADYEKYATDPVVYTVKRSPWVRSVKDSPLTFTPWTFSTEVS